MNPDVSDSNSGSNSDSSNVQVRPITSLLVANRGEIARRIMRTARAMGITTIAVYSDADAQSPHAAEADVAVRLPGVTPGDTYLRHDLLLEAAQRSGADAIHPGYGFLSESGEFARAVVAAGLIWVGPPADAIDAMGSKIGSKDMMRAAGVPTLPSITVDGDTPPDPDAVALLGWPLLVKASAGGGGRGMRIVEGPDALADALAPQAAGKRFLLARASRGRQVLPEQLAAAGGIVEQVVVYASNDVETADPQITAALEAGHVDWVTVTSSAIARAIVGLFGDQLRKARLASISPITSETLRELGHPPAAEATEYTMAGLVAAIAECGVR